jgi:hypothetical protein
MQPIVRAHLLEWLERHAHLPLRALIAPPGFGKTTLLQQYVQRHAGCAYVAAGRLRRLTEPFTMILCERLGMPIDAGRSTEAMLCALDALAPCEIAIDEIDALSIEDRDALSTLVLHAPHHLSIVLAARSREAIGDPRRLLDGTTALLDVSSLAFTAPEIAELSRLLNVDATGSQIARLREESEGWPLVAAAAIRIAAECGRNLEGAMHRWNARCGATLREMILADAAQTQLGALLVRLCSAPGTLASDELRMLERAGLYVRRIEGRYALLRAAAAAFEPVEPTDVASLPDIAPIFVQLLGEFDVRIAGRQVEWVRRKDALLFKYLLLEPHGRVSRRELAEAFWPTHDRQQAAQNLRTTCSNVRTALRRVLPASRADLYFRTDGRDIVLRNDLAVTDLARFFAHVRAAREAMAAQQLDRAVEAYDAARAIYRGPLIVEPPKEAHEAIAREVDESFNEAQRHLTALRRFGAGAVRAPAAVSVATA